MRLGLQRVDIELLDARQVALNARDVPEVFDRLLEVFAVHRGNLIGGLLLETVQVDQHSFAPFYRDKPSKDYN